MAESASIDPRSVGLSPDRTFARHDSGASRDECLSWVRDVAEILGCEPSQGIGDSYSSFVHLPRETIRGLAPLLQERPSTARILDVAGPSWFEVLVASGVLPNGAVRGTRGTRVLANDGCVCLSRGEKTIDDMLASEGIAHERERRYPGSALRTDWKCGDVYIEYFGLTGDPAYDLKTATKLRLAAAHDLPLIALYPADLLAPSELRDRLRVALAGAPRMKPVVAIYQPTTFTYLSFDERLRARKGRRVTRLRELKQAGARRNAHLGVIEFLEKRDDSLRVPHRFNGPAEIWDNGTEVWKQHGRRHRDDGGPAIIGRAPERYEWFRNDVPFRDAGKPIEMTRRRDGGWQVVFMGDDGRYSRQKFGPDEPLPDGWLDFPPYAPLHRT